MILGQHADDCVETVLLNLFRGSGGLNRPQSPTEIIIGGRPHTFHRPLYPVWREEIDSYIAEHGIEFREDASNRDLEFLRNRIRHRLIPMLAEIFERDVTKIINRAATIACDEDEYLRDQIEDRRPPIILEDGRISAPQLAALPVALQRRVIHQWLKQHQITKISFDKIEECLTLLDIEHGPAKINLPGDRHARRQSRMLFIE